VLNIEDSHVASYSLKKLVDYGYAEYHQHGRDRLYRPTADGEDLCKRYLELRREALVAGLSLDGADLDAISAAGRALTRLAGYYAQASRTAAVLSRK
jgi:predicted MarR family transcription regulator